MYGGIGEELPLWTATTGETINSELWCQQLTSLQQAKMLCFHMAMYVVWQFLIIQYPYAELYIEITELIMLSYFEWKMFVSDKTLQSI